MLSWWRSQIPGCQSLSPLCWLFFLTPTGILGCILLQRYFSSNTQPVSTNGNPRNKPSREKTVSRQEAWRFGLRTVTNSAGLTMSNQTSSLQSRERARSSSSTQNEEKDAAKLSFFRSIQLRLLNCGSVARDHLALERTYLAYVRTSLGLCSAGIGLTVLLPDTGTVGLTKPT